jgi:hypothetical protein
MSEGAENTSSSALETTPEDDTLQGYLMLRGLILPLPRKHDFILGRSKTECDIVLAHEHISRQHAIVSFRGGHYFIRDLGSLSGTYVNGERVNGLAPLTAGDELRLPPYMMLFFGPDKTTDAAKPAARTNAGSGLKTEPGRKTGSISGLLSILSVTDIIQLVNFTTQSGVLSVRTPDLQVSEMVFCDGEIVQARYMGKSGVSAIFASLSITSGEFEFVQGDPPRPEDCIQENTVSLLLEGSRLLDEAGVSGNLSTTSVR